MYQYLLAPFRIISIVCNFVLYSYYCVIVANLNFSKEQMCKFEFVKGK